MTIDQKKAEEARALNQQKQVAYYSALVNGWLTTRLEQDKHLLSLSTFSIGLLVTLATTVGFKSCYAQVLGLLSALCFCITVFSVMSIFEKNSDMAKSQIQNDANSQKVVGNELSKLDLYAASSFKFGVVMLIATAIAVSATANQTLEKAQMTEEKQTNYPILPEEVPIRKSWEGLGDVQPPPVPDDNDSDQS